MIGAFVRGLTNEGLWEILGTVSATLFMMAIVAIVIISTINLFDKIFFRKKGENKE